VNHITPHTPDKYSTKLQITSSSPIPYAIRNKHYGWYTVVCIIHFDPISPDITPNIIWISIPSQSLVTPVSPSYLHNKWWTLWSVCHILQQLCFYKFYYSDYTFS
jgi:hypothetical protein